MDIGLLPVRAYFTSIKKTRNIIIRLSCFQKIPHTAYWKINRITSG